MHMEIFKLTTYILSILIHIYGMECQATNSVDIFEIGIQVIVSSTKDFFWTQRCIYG